MKRNMFATIFLMLFVSLFYTYSAVDPAWYKIVYEEYAWTTTNNTNIQWQGNTNLSLGRFGFNKSQVFRDIANAAGQNGEALWTDAEKNLTFVFTTTPSPPQLINTEDSTKRIDLSYVVTTGGSPTTITQNETVVTATMDGNLESEIYFNLTLPPANSPGFVGSYTSNLLLQIYAEYDTEDPVLIGEHNYAVAVYYINKTNPNQQIIITLDVHKSPAADNIDALYLADHPTESITIGSATFTSTDKRSTSAYTLKISPKIDPILGKFHFKHERYNSTIFYKVHVLPNRTNPVAYAFTVDVPAPTGNSTWNDVIDLAISGVTLPTGGLIAGEYTSTIVIELESN